MVDLWQMEWPLFLWLADVVAMVADVIATVWNVSGRCYCLGGRCYGHKGLF